MILNLLSTKRRLNAYGHRLPVFYFATLFLGCMLFLNACNKQEKDPHAGHNHAVGEGHDAHPTEETPDIHADEIIFSKKQANAVGMKTEVISPQPFAQIIKTSGQIIAAQGDEATVVATSSGIISYGRLNISEGSNIHSGETIVTISAKNIADGDPVLKAKMAFETVKKEYDRDADLVEDQIISMEKFEQTRLRYETAKVAYDAFSSHSSAKGVMVLSPIQGFIKTLGVKQGEYVSVGQVIATVSKNKRLQLRAEVLEKHFAQLKGITDAYFKTSYSTKLYKLAEMNGKLLSFGKTSQQNTFYIPIIFEMDNVGDLIPGAFTEIYLRAGVIPQALSVPLSSLIEEQGHYFVYVKLDDEGYQKQGVTLGANDGERVHVLTGLQSGDCVVTEGAFQIKLAANSAVIPEGHNH